MDDICFFKLDICENKKQSNTKVNKVHKRKNVVNLMTSLTIKYEKFNDCNECNDCNKCNEFKYNIFEKSHPLNNRHPVTMVSCSPILSSEVWHMSSNKKRVN